MSLWNDAGVDKYPENEKYQEAETWYFDWDSSVDLNITEQLKSLNQKNHFAEWMYHLFDTFSWKFKWGHNRAGAGSASHKKETIAVYCMILFLHDEGLIPEYKGISTSRWPTLMEELFTFWDFVKE